MSIAADTAGVMTQRDIRPCVVCGRGVMHAGAITFYRVRLERMVIDMRAVRRHVGLELILGSPAIAFHIGPQEAIAKTHPDLAAAAIVCDDCAVSPTTVLATIIEAVNHADEAETDPDLSPERGE